MDWLQLISIFFEFIIVILALMLAVKKKKVYGYTFALTFGIYVFYDLSKLLNFEISEIMLSIIFFIATISALFSIWKVYKDKK
ncbi:MAG: hypothetical protein WC781_05145 [Candidatus Pacearchaeota archaeon]|jgi:hypothetical protein